MDSQRIRDLLLKLADRFAEISDLCRQTANVASIVEQTQSGIRQEDTVREKQNFEQTKSLVEQIQRIESETSQTQDREEPQIHTCSNKNEQQDTNVQTLLDYVLNIRKYIRKCEEEYQNLGK